MASERSSTTRMCARCRQPLGDAVPQEGFHSLYCAPCAAALTAAVHRLRKTPEGAPAASEPAPNPTPVHPQAKVTPQAAPTPPPIPLAGDVLLIPEPSGPSAMRVVHHPTVARPGAELGVSAPDPSVKIQTRVCLNCSHAVVADNPVCAFCKYDARKGVPKALQAETPNLKCRKCGYDLAGLKKPICPECGSKVSLRIRPNWQQRSSEEIRKEAYRRPIVMLSIGLGAWLLFEFARSGWDFSPPLFALITFAINVPIMLGVYVACAYGWIGFDMPPHLITLRLAAVRAVAELTMAVLLWLIPIPLIGWGLSYVTYVYLLHTELDIDLQDAVVLAILTLGVHILLYLILVVKIGNALGAI